MGPRLARWLSKWRNTGVGIALPYCQRSQLWNVRLGR